MLPTDTRIPFHMRGNYRPVTDELTAQNLPIEGTIPAELDGYLVRNGANPRSVVPPHWFFGDGMLHAIELSGGQALGYRNRWVRTRVLEDPTVPRFLPDGSRDLTVTVANTHVIAHAGQLLALAEGGLPIAVDAALETVGPYDFGGALRTPMTAHPKRCPSTGELHFIGYDFQPPFVTYHRANCAGELVQSEPIEVRAPTFMHDLAITQRHVVLMDLPVVFDWEQAHQGKLPFRWSDSYGARIGIMPRGGRSSDMRWFEIEPCFVFHVQNAYHRTDDGEDRVVLDAVRYARIMVDSSDVEARDSFLHRWVFDMQSGDVVEQLLDDRPVEFPRIDERRTGLPYRYGYTLERPHGEISPYAILRYDLETGRTFRRGFPSGHTPDEAVFVPAAPESQDGREDEGWLLTVVYDASRDSSYVAVMDVKELEAPPMGIIHLPRRVPFGFHGSWVPRTALRPPRRP